MRIEPAMACIAILLSLTAQAATASDDRVSEALSVPCNGCHGPDGVSPGVSIPSIAGLNAEFMNKVLEQYRDGSRKATIMNRIARGYKVYELRKIARYFSRKPWTRVDSDLEDAMVERGREVHEQHCAECHEDAGRYQDRDTPRLAGQRPVYLQLQLQQYLNRELPQPSDMKEKLALLKEEDLPALSAFYSSVD
jgi:sulfide dehydrogenase cytochrome subunit